MSLHIQEVSKAFGGVQALQDISLDVPAGEVLGLVGPNGAGKTTLINVVTGVFRPDAGRIGVSGEDVTGHRIESVARLGVARTYQHIRLFEESTVLDNVLAGCHGQFERASTWRPSQARAFGALQRKRAQKTCDRLGLGDLVETLASSLSYGQRRRVEIARALVSEPSVLLLDEPAAGMTLAEAEGVGDLVKELGGADMAVVLIEHNVNLVSNACDRLAVLDWGKLIKIGRPDEVWADAAVRAAYLGVEAAS